MPTLIKRKKEKFARNRFREQDAGNFFKKTSNGLSNAFSLIVAIFFTPALITSSIISKEILVSFANIFLSLGYLTNFCYRMYKGEMSKAELIVSALALAAVLTASFLLFPPAAGLSALALIQIANQAAVVINMFFLIRHVVVPPAKHLIEKIAHHLGFDIAGQYYSKPGLTLDRDRFVIDRILEKNYAHDSHATNYKPAQLTNLNNLLTKLIQYINKYDEALFGYIRNKDKISTLEKSIEQLTIKGDSDSSYGFVKNKLRFKITKLQLLQDAKFKVEKALADPSMADEALSYFHKPLFQKKQDKTALLQAGLDNLQQEINRQQAKINSLQECLPIEAGEGFANLKVAQ